MSRRANRPTNDNYQDYLIDFSNVDFSQYGDIQPQQEEPKEEPGFWEKAYNSGAAILEGLTMMPQGVWDTVKDTWNGGEIDVMDRAAIEERRQREAEKQAYQQKWEGKTFGGVSDAMVSMPYSVATMGAALGAGTTGMLAGPVAGGAAAMGASGAVAYRATKQDFLHRLLDKTEEALGRTPTQDEWNRIASEFDSEATKYGAYEAIPEAVGNLLFMKLLGPLGNKLLKGGLGSAAKRVGGAYGEEFATETVTQIGQGEVEADMGWRDEAPNAWEAFKEIAPATFWQTTLMGGAKKVADYAYNRIARRKDEVENNADETQQAPQQQALPPGGNAPLELPLGQNIEMGWDGTGNGPIAPEAISPETQEGLFGAWDNLNGQTQNTAPEISPQMRQGLFGVWDDFSQNQQPQQDERQVLFRPQREGLFGAWDEMFPQQAKPSMQEQMNGGETVDLLNPQESERTVVEPQIASEPAQAATPQISQPVQNIRQPVQPIMPDGMLGGIPGFLDNAAPQGIPQVAPMPTQSELTNTQQAPRADTRQAVQDLGMPAPEAIPQAAQPAPVMQPMAQMSQQAQYQPAPQQPLAGMPGFQNAAQENGGLWEEPAPAPASNEAGYDVELPANERGVENAGQETGKQPGVPGLQPGDSGPNVQLSDGNEAGAARGRAQESGEGNSAQEGTGRNRRKLKIPNRPDEDVSFELREADEVQASHLPEAGFQKNPRYQFENERRYHDEPASRADVLDHARELDPDMLMESVDASQGAPIIDKAGNVLGGNSRAMSIRHAYDKFPQRAEAYRQALKERAESLGLDPAQIDRMKKPMLVRSMDRDMDAKERQEIVPALNDSFTKSKDKRASGKSRGDRLTPKTLEALGRGLQEADSLREYFDKSESASVVEMLIKDGVIQPTERNAFVAEDGQLNPDGKKIVEEALRGRVAKSYEALDALPAAVIGKIDAAIPYVLIAENVGGEWNITPHVRDAVDLVAEFQASKIEKPQTFLKQLDMTKGGKAPMERYSPQAQSLFLMMLEAKKKEFANAFARFASQAKLSTGGLGVGLESDVAFDESFEGKRRAELIDMLPKEEVHNARRKMTNQQIKERLKEIQREKKAAVNKDTEGQSKQRDNDPFGQAYPEYSGKGAEAIEHLLEVKQGYVPAAFNKEGLGDIDILWGNKKLGLEHIINRRSAQGLDGIAFVRRLPEIIENGRVEDDPSDADTMLVINDNEKAVIALKWRGEKRTWLVTSYPKYDSFQSPDSNTPLNQARVGEQNPSPNSGTENNLINGEGPVNRDYGTIDKPNTIALGDYFVEQFAAGKRYDNIVQARRAAGQLLHGKNNIPPAQFKAIDESIELGVVKTARNTIAEMRKEGKNDIEIFKSLVDLYQCQPNLSSRTSKSIEQQAYSTPAPIAFLASRLAGINENSTVYEPSAGNGMLLMEATPQNITANELNPERAERLRSQGFTVTEQDAVDFKPPYGVDVVIENPPFGRVWDSSHKDTIEMNVDGFATKELDQAIVVKSLKALKQKSYGRAVLIIGGKQGNEAARKQKYKAESQRQFWKYLSENYNIHDHFSIDGKLYSRQGASYPIDVIVLDNQGKTQGYVFPGGKPPRIYSSFEQMEELLNGQQMDTGRVPAGDTVAGRGRDAGGESDTASGTAGRVSAEDVSGRDRPGSERRGESGRTDRHGQDNAANSSEQRTGELERPERDSARSNGQEEGSDLGNAGRRSAAEQNNDVADLEGRDVSAESENMGRSGGIHQDGSDKLGGNDSAGVVENRQEKGKKEKPLKATQFQTPYKKASKLPSLGTLVPKNMVTAVNNAFAAFKKEHGDIDKFVAKELGYKEAELGDHFAAEQVDAIGLAIHNLQKDAGFIIGDQTGIGKGRVNAAIIRWAKRNGKIPVFITMNPQLYGDMVRDLQDIGMPGFNPLTTNVLTGSDAIELPDGRKLKTKSGSKHKQLLQQVAREGLGEEYDAIFTTYNQLDSSGDNHRRKFMQDMAPRALFILDEAHNAGGTQGQQRKAKDSAPSRAEFVRDLLKSSPNGVFYSSATYAKRPDVMDLYMKTDMRHAVNDGESLGDAINRGGIPMQQIVAAQLAQSGQYLRRERTWEGADVETHSVKTDTKRADACADAMRAIMEFDRAKQEALGDLKDSEAGGGFNVDDNKSANESGISSIGFSSIMHNLISQSVLSQKVDAIVDACDTAIKNGEKPVITLSNTMGSAIEEYARVNDIAVGDQINITFEDMFLRYLDKTRTIKKKEGKKIVEERLLTDEELGPQAVTLYKKAQEIIRKSGVRQLPVSFIDMIEEGLRKKGISIGEITGRNVGIDYSGSAPVLAKRENTTSDKINTVNSFNSGSLDAVVLNSSGSTGISLHASEKFKDQRRRTMIVAQPDGNIDVFMQTLGRIFRTGQVVPPKYQLLFTDIPAEKRQAAVLAKKMASLNANTSAAKDSDASFKNIPDFMNKYGDRVAMQIINDNPVLHEKMGSPLEKKDNSRGGDSIEGAMQKLTGYIPLLPVKEQKVIYDQLETAYKDLTEQLEAMGALDLEAKPMPLDAKLINEEEITPRKDIEGTTSPFTAAAKLGKYDVKKLGKPLPLEKVKELVAEGEAIDPRDDRPAFDKWLANKLKNISDKKRDDFRRRAENNYETLKALANTFKPGVPVMIENGNDGQKIAGVVTNVSKKGKADNPVALGNYHVEIAVADPAKKLTFPLSQIADSSTTNYKFEANAITRDEVYKAIEDGQSDARESVYIATGNVLAAFERLEKGRVIVFEDHEGNLTPGLMLPKTASISEILNGLDVALTPSQAMAFLKKCDPKTAMLKTEDKACAITRTGEDTFDMAAPGSKAKGGQYFLNGAILEAAGKDFVKSGNSMVLRGLSGTKMQAVLEAMAGQNTGFIADNNKEVAREVSGQKQISSSSFNKKQDNRHSTDNSGNTTTPSASIKPGQFLPSRNENARGTRAAAVRNTVDALNRSAKNAANTEVVQSFADLPQHIREEFEGKTVEAAYDPRTKKVWFVADNIENATRAAEVWAHEQIVHHGLRGMLSEGDRTRMLNSLWLKMGGMGNPLIKERAKLYGLKPTVNSNQIPLLMEEVIAHLAETKKLGKLNERQQSMWRNIVNAILRAWNKIVERVTGRKANMGYEQADNLLTALGNYVINGENAFDLQAGTAGAMASVGEDKVNSYGVPMERVTVIEGNITQEELGKALEELSGRNLINILEGLTAQVNSNQRTKLVSAVARAKSMANGFTGNEHNIAASKIENAWKWAAEVPGMRGSKPEQKDVKIRRFFSAVSINGKDAFLELTVKDSNAGLRLYSAELLNEKELRVKLGDADNNSSTSPRRSFNEIIDRLKGPVNEADAPLASLNLRDIVRMGSRQAAQLANEPEIRHLFKRNDLTLLQNVVQLPHWIAKQFKEFADIYNRQLKRMDERSAAVMKSLETVPSLFGKNRLGKRDMDSLRELLWQLEGAETKLEQDRKVEKFISDGTLANGRTKLAINPKFYDVYQEVLDEHSATTKAKAAMMEIRKSLDNDLLLAYNRMASMEEMADDAIKQLRENIGHVPNYFPHHRYGKYFIQAKKDGEVVFRQHFDALNEKLAQAKAREIVRQQQANYPDAEWMDGENSKLPDEVLGAPIDSSAMEQIIRAATSKIGDKEKAAQINDLLVKSVADVLKTRGWGSHGIQRKGVPGYETEDIEKVLYDYKSGLNGWLTKMEAARDFSSMLGKIDAQKQPKLWKYASQYIKDMLRNSDNIDRTVGKIKSAAFAWYLGANIKTAFVNATQNLIVGVPRLQMDVKGGGRLWLTGAQDALVDQITGKKGNNLTDNEYQMLRKLYDQNVITDAFMEEVRGHMEGFSGANAWNKFTKIMGLPMSMVERFNRASLALAAYRAATRGALKAAAKKKYGINDKATHEQAIKFATEVVRDAHFVYGKTNMPEFMRSNAAGRAISSMYTFRTFSHNMLAMWAWALKTQGREGAIFTAKSLGATMALGGVTALPLYATLMALFQLASGDDDDWTEMIRDSLPNDNLLRDVVCYGMPAIAGVNVGGSLKMETPLTRGLRAGATPEEVLTKSIGDIIGIPYDLGIVRTSRVMDAVDKGNYWRAIEEAVPTFVKNGMQAWRMYAEGQTTMAGRSINSPGQKGARKLTESEAIAKALGFQPVSSTKSYDAYSAQKRHETVRSDKLNEVTIIALKAYDTGDKTYQRKAIKEMEVWNERMKKEGKLYMMFNWKDVMRRVKARRRENSNNPKQLEKGGRQLATWGI